MCCLLPSVLTFTEQSRLELYPASSPSFPSVLSCLCSDGFSDHQPHPTALPDLFSALLVQGLTVGSEGSVSGGDGVGVQRNPRDDLLQNGLVGSPCSPRDSQESSPTPQFKASILQRLAFFIVQLSHPYMTSGKTIALTRWTFVGKVMSLLLPGQEQAAGVRET